MNQHQPFALSGSRIITPNGERPAALLIDAGTISAIVSPNDIPSRYPVTDAGSSVVMPGLIDTHVHINEPGRTEWEGFASATKAAAAGGITTLIDMPLNSTPVTTTTRAFNEKIAAAEGKLFVHCGFYAGLIPGNELEIEPLIDAGVFGVKAFLTHSGIDDFPNATEQELRSVMPVMAHRGIPLLVHAELETSSTKISSTRSYAEYLASRPREWERRAVELMVRLCTEYRCKTHIVHLSSADEAEALSLARAAGLPLTVETCPHYLYFNAEEIAEGATHFKCAPPIRERKNQDALWKALKSGIIDMIVSDHSPCPPEMKYPDIGDFMKAWGGIASLQFGLPAVWTEAKLRGFSLSDVSRWMSAGPASLVGLDRKKGSLARGFDADLVVFQPEKSFIVTRSSILHRHTMTPYEGRTLHGIVEQTYLGGKLIYDGNRIIGEPSGELLLRI